MAGSFKFLYATLYVHTKCNPAYTLLPWLPLLALMQILCIHNAHAMMSEGTCLLMGGYHGNIPVQLQQLCAVMCSQ